MGELIIRQPQQEGDGGALAKRFPFNAGRLYESFLSGMSSETSEAYARDLRLFSEFLGVDDPKVAIQQMIEAGAGQANMVALEFRTWMEQKGHSTNSVARRLAALRSLMKLAGKFGFITWTLNVKAPKIETYRDTRGPGVEGVRKMLDVIERFPSPRKERDRAIVMIAFCDALRKTEMTSLNLEHINLADSTVSVMGKGRNEREIMTVPPKAMAAIKAWIDVRGLEPGPLFFRTQKGQTARSHLSKKGMYHIVSDIGKRAGIKVKPHGLRHAGITAALESGRDIREVMKFSRHKKIDTVIIYDDRREDMQGQVAASAEGML
jgi:integrase/recombinase XerC